MKNSERKISQSILSLRVGKMINYLIVFIKQMTNMFSFYFVNQICLKKSYLVQVITVPSQIFITVSKHRNSVNTLNTQNTFI